MNISFREDNTWHNLKRLQIVESQNLFDSTEFGESGGVIREEVFLKKFLILQNMESDSPKIRAEIKRPGLIGIFVKLDAEDAGLNLNC
ncbi:MAG: hypothetical protein WCC06_00340 [Candidatus Aminicenantales bacterium]